MAMLTGPEIEEQIRLCRIVIDPLPKKFGANSVDLTLGQTLLVYESAWRVQLLHEAVETCRQRAAWECDQIETDSLGDVFSANTARRKEFDEAMQALQAAVLKPLDMQSEEPTREIGIPYDGIVLFPGILYLGHTEEWTETPNHVPCVEGRSSIGRLGLNVHATAGFGDRGFRGDWTLELSVVQPLRIYAGVKICQIFYTETVGVAKPYAGKYQEQRGPKPSGLWKEFQQ